MYLDPYVSHNRIAKMYTWQNVAKRTEMVITSEKNISFINERS